MSLFLGKGTLPGGIGTYGDQSCHPSNAHPDYDGPGGETAGFLLAFRRRQVELVPNHTLLAIKLGHALQTQRCASLADKTSIIIVSFHGNTSRVLCVEVPVLRGIAGEALAVVVAGNAVVGAVGTDGPSLALQQQIG